MSKYEQVVEEVAKNMRLCRLGACPDMKTMRNCTLKNTYPTVTDCAKCWAVYTFSNPSIGIIDDDQQFYPPIYIETWQSNDLFKGGWRKLVEKK